MRINHHNLRSSDNQTMLSIIIPAYDIIPDTKQVKEALKGIDHEIIVQYDIDGEGKGATLRRGFKYTKGEFIAWLDADMEIPPIQLIGMLETMKETRADVVIGSKLLNLKNVKYPLSRLLLSWVGYMIIKILFKLPVHDTQTGIKLFRREALRGKWVIDGFGHDVEVLYCAHKRMYKIVEYPIYIPKKLRGSVTLMSVLRTLKEVLWVRFII